MFIIILCSDAYLTKKNNEFQIATVRRQNSFLPHLARAPAILRNPPTVRIPNGHWLRRNARAHIFVPWMYKYISSFCSDARLKETNNCRTVSMGRQTCLLLNACLIPAHNDGWGTRRSTKIPSSSARQRSTALT